MDIHFSSAQFSTSVFKVSQLPPDTGAEITFAGRSNAGKSSAINAITNIRKLAHTSKTPGRTQCINFFDVAEHYRLVDLPGFGYAKVPAKVRQQWKTLIDDYLRVRCSLRGMIHVMDSRHPLTDFDWQLVEWCAMNQLSLHVLLTKSDKLSKSKACSALIDTQRRLQDKFQDASVNVSIQLFSALKRQGIQEAQKVLSSWLLGKD